MIWLCHLSTGTGERLWVNGPLAAIIIIIYYIPIVFLPFNFFKRKYTIQQGQKHPQEFSSNNKADK